MGPRGAVIPGPDEVDIARLPSACVVVAVDEAVEQEAEIGSDHFPSLRYLCLLDPQGVASTWLGDLVGQLEFSSPGRCLGCGELSVVKECDAVVVEGFAQGGRRGRVRAG